MKRNYDIKEVEKFTLKHKEETFFIVDKRGDVVEDADFHIMSPIPMKTKNIKAYVIGGDTLIPTHKDGKIIYDAEIIIIDDKSKGD